MTFIGGHIRRNGVAYVALFFALTGTAAALAGHNSVRSDDIKNGQVRTADLANGAVTGAKAKDGSLGAADLAPGTLGFVKSGDLKRIDYNPTGCVTTNTPGCAQDVLHLGGLTLNATCGNSGGADAELKLSSIGAVGSDLNFGYTYSGSSAAQGGFGDTGTIADLINPVIGGVGTIVYRSPGETISISFNAFAQRTGSDSFCQVQGTALRTT